MATCLRRKGFHQRRHTGRHAVLGKAQRGTSRRQRKRRRSVRSPRRTSRAHRACAQAAAPLRAKRARPVSPRCRGARTDPGAPGPALLVVLPPGPRSLSPPPPCLKERARPSPARLAVCASRKLCPQRARQSEIRGHRQGG